MSRPTFLHIALRAPLLLVASCEWGGGPGASALTAVDAHQSVTDAPGSQHDAGADASTDATGIQSDAPQATTAHILLTEIALAPTGAEFIELYNPTGATVDLSTYYLANTGTYYKLPTGAPTLPSGHFIVQFAVGVAIAAGSVVTVATDTAFHAAYGVDPSYSIADGTVTRTAGHGTADLTDSGTAVVLFQWDGTSGLVKDVDIMVAGKPLVASALVNKSGITQMAMTYATDALTIAAQAAAPGSGKSTKRVATETGHETQAGIGNGLTGHDETSEDTATTWDTTFNAPTPGQVPTL
jgi:hypothetical protein